MQRNSISGRRLWLCQVGIRIGKPATALAGGFLLVGMILGLTGCGQIDLSFLASLRDEPGGAPTLEEEQDRLVKTPLELIGESADAVQRLLGEPRGRLHTGNGVVWLYPEWRIQIDDERQVTAVEREIPVSAGATGGTARGTAGPAVNPGQQRALTVVSNGGQEVNLASLLVPGKVTVVDFYADWCGPCRQLSPHLDRLAREDPDVNVVKVDIVKWNTPVTRQHNIRSVPNLRVYDRKGRAVGTPTSDFRQVLRAVEQAKRKP
jgi:thiol-disulfide isomerase/thioredoxin